jgi:hypothetical protein
MYPDERALAEWMKDRPFALLSVNTDEDKDSLRKSLASGKITWRCWWEGGVVRPIYTKWLVDQLPTIYVINAHGNIRAKHLRGKVLEEVFDRLMKEGEPHPPQSQ